MKNEIGNHQEAMEQYKKNLIILTVFRTRKIYIVKKTLGV